MDPAEPQNLTQRARPPQWGFPQHSETSDHSGYKPGSTAYIVHHGYLHFFRIRIGINPGPVPREVIEFPEDFARWAQNHNRDID